MSFLGLVSTPVLTWSFTHSAFKNRVQQNSGRLDAFSETLRCNELLRRGFKIDVRLIWQANAVTLVRHQYRNWEVSFFKSSSMCLPLNCSTLLPMYPPIHPMIRSAEPATSNGHLHFPGPDSCSESASTWNTNYWGICHNEGQKLWLNLNQTNVRVGRDPSSKVNAPHKRLHFVLPANTPSSSY